MQRKIYVFCIENKNDKPVTFGNREHATQGERSLNSFTVSYQK